MTAEINALSEIYPMANYLVLLFSFFFFFNSSVH